MTGDWWLQVLVLLGVSAVTLGIVVLLIRRM